MAATEITEEIDRSAISDLVANYQALTETDRRQKKEAAVRQQYINPLLRALGWDTESEEVRPEYETDVGPADYAIVLNGKDQYYLEAKKFADDLDGYRIEDGEKRYYVNQAIDYAYHQRCDWAVLTNFEEIRLYWTHASRDSLEDGLVLKLTVDEYETSDGLEDLGKLSKTGVSRGSLETMQLARERDPITEAVLNTLSKARIKLTRDIHANEPDLDLETLREGVQRILDRLVVIRVAEDRRVIAGDTLRKMMEAWNSTKINPQERRLIRDFVNAFQDFNSVYNSALFASHDCENWDISNEVLQTIIEGLYEYNFEYLDADILGSIYEDYLGHAIEDKAEGLELEEHADERREGGIYYTPVPVVEYIVDVTLGERLDAVMDEVRAELAGEEPDFEAARAAFNQVEEVRFLDVSCGSGSFLIKAYDKFVECYEEFDGLVRKARTADMGVGDFTSAQYTPTDYRRRVLRNNLFGVDLDHQATEIATVNLFLKALKQGEELPTILDENIQQGNSLLNGCPDEVADMLSDGETDDPAAFDWEARFDTIFEEDGGFTCIAGNPPWGADMTAYEEWLEADDHYELAAGQYNSYELFMELGSKLLQDGGTLGFIIPDSIFNDEYENTRRWLLDNHQVNRVHKLGEGLFDSVYHPTAIIQFSNVKPSLDAPVEVSVLRKADREEVTGAHKKALKNIIEAKGDTKTVRRFVEDDDYEFRLWAKEADHKIIDIMEADSVDWQDVIDNGRGDETGRDGNIMKCPSCMRWDSYPRKRSEEKGGGYYDKTCTHCGHEYAFENAVATRQIVSETQTDTCDRPIYFGEHVNRYRTSGQAYIDDSYSDDLAMKPESRFEPPKMLIRRSSFGFFATIDYSNARSLKANLVFRLLDDRDEPFDEYDLEYFLGFLNSRAMLYYWSKVTNTVEWESHIRHTQTFVMSLPIPEIDWSDDEMVQKYRTLVQFVRQSVRSDEPIDEDTDWEIERLVMDLYGLDPNQRQRIFDELQKVQRMRIVRELFPDGES